ncbi:hypothetical protein CIC12_03510 [Burkholderia sp. SG-MS1]|uniref:hypothetical protein n=1 Tax=Paraburkholderia sp. SG-MS1 TaxID=2023741 RepID=UPI001444FA47|nr:hypothetical protein [Paraburkholderia sp. SG-MS1]NKJ45824.1 hypothetical protein [Paraburkholderia sp. SG-MS1]
MKRISRAFRASRAARVLLCASTCGFAVHAGAQGLSVQNDMNAPQNSTRLMPNAVLGSEYPTHGNQQAGELNLNPTDPRAQLANGLPNYTSSGGYGSPLAGVRAYVQPQPPMQPSAPSN